MWFRSKAKNRRLGREHVLDVKLRTREVRAARLKLAGTAAAISLGAVIGLFLIWRTGEWALHQFVLQNDAFAIRTVDIQTDGEIPLEQLRRWAAVKPGDNLLALDLARIKRDLELAPSILSVAVERVLPHTLRVRVTEREAIARVTAPQLRVGGGVQLVTFYLDETGHVITPLENAASKPPGAPQFDDTLPLLLGVNPAELSSGQAVSTPKINSALQLIAGFETSPMSGLVNLRTVDLSGAEILQVTTGQGSRITFGIHRLEEQFRRWRLVHDYGQKSGRVIRTLDLSVTNNSPVLWAEASTVPPVNPKPAKPIRNRKKHV